MTTPDFDYLLENGEFQGNMSLYFRDNISMPAKITAEDGAGSEPRRFYVYIVFAVATVMLLQNLSGNICAFSNCALALLGDGHYPFA